MYEPIGQRLFDRTLLATKAFIGGEWCDAHDGKTFEVTNPSTGELLSSLPDFGVAETKQAIDKAYSAQKLWAAKTAKKRSNIMRNLFNLMVENADDLAIILTAEMGKPLAEAKGEILYGASYMEWFAEEAKRIYGDVLPGHQADKRIVILKQPVGVVASITPWNFPNAMVTRKIAPALAAGCAFVGKPAAETPLSALPLQN